MKASVVAALLSALIGSASALGQSTVREVILKTGDGTELKATYFAAHGQGPAVLLYHQSNRTRASWDSVARQLAAAGIHTLTVDSRGRGESGGKHDNWQHSWKEARTGWWPGDLDAGFEWLTSQPGVKREMIGVGGAGLLGVDSAVETARRHSANVNSLVLLSGETLRPQLQFLHEASHLPELFVVSDDDEYPPTQQAMQLLYASASSPAKKLIHYVAKEEAPWKWYEPTDIGKVPAQGGHGTDLFTSHPELPGIIVHWFTTTLIETPGYATADPVAAGPLLAEVEFAGGVAHARQQLLEARKRSPDAQVWPEISMSIIGQDLMRDGDTKAAVDVLELNLLAYPESADANETLAEAYLADRQKDLARQYAEKSLGLLRQGQRQASSWTNTEEYRGEIRRGAERVLRESDSSAGAVNSARANPGNIFRDCPACPEMVIVPAGSFTMGSSLAEKQWAATHGGNLESVADESPQHVVTLRSFALGRYPVTRGEYAAFVRETGHFAGDGCGRDSFKWNKEADLNWQNPGFDQSDRDPAVCVSWQDAQAYINWLNNRLRDQSPAPGRYRLPSESEWEYATRAGSTTYFWWGDDESKAPTHAWFKANSGGRTHPVGLKPMNSFGLYDVVGNVWQWTEDCYAESYATAPADGRANPGDTDCLRVDRGGSWLYPAWLLRSATRERNPANYRDVIMGLRVVKELPPS